MIQAQRSRFVLIGIAVVILVGVVIYTQRNKLPLSIERLQRGSSPTATPPPAQLPVDISEAPYRGDPTAKVKIIYFFDFQCPYCQRFELTTLPLLDRDYLKTGKAVLYVKNFQFLGDDSVTAGIASKCLVKQIKSKQLSFESSYWPWHLEMFQRQDKENSGWGKAADIKKLVSKLQLPGIDIQQFNQCLDQTEMRQAVERELVEAENLGLQGTPAFLINGERLSGFRPYSVFQEILERHLRQ